MYTVLIPEINYLCLCLWRCSLSTIPLSWGWLAVVGWCLTSNKRHSDFSHLPPVSTIPVVHLDQRISGLGRNWFMKNCDVEKILWHCPFLSHTMWDGWKYRSLNWLINGVQQWRYLYLPPRSIPEILSKTNYRMTWNVVVIRIIFRQRSLLLLSIGRIVHLHLQQTRDANKGNYWTQK
jgi:hypothetical protein